MHQVAEHHDEADRHEHGDDEHLVEAEKKFNTQWKTNNSRELQTLFKEIGTEHNWFQNSLSYFLPRKVKPVQHPLAYSIE